MDTFSTLTEFAVANVAEIFGAATAAPVYLGVVWMLVIACIQFSLLIGRVEESSAE